MRDPKRIEPLLREVEAYWKAHPDWRLCQLVVNVASEGNDPFYVEDDTFLERLRVRASSEQAPK